MGWTGSTLQRSVLERDSPSKGNTGRTSLAHKKFSRQLLQQPHLSVVIINYRQWEETHRLVRQLQSAECLRDDEAEIVVVDNHSPMHPLVSRIRRGVSLRRWGRNRGYARGANEGYRLSRGRWLLLLNPDVSVPAGFLDGVRTLIERLTKEEKRAGIVGFQLRNSNGSPQLSAGPFPTFWSTLAGLAWPRQRRKYRPVYAGRRRLVPWVTGCCLLVRRECLEQLGGFDEDYFLYYEDVDLCHRARARGWTILYEPALRVIHHNPLHLRPVSVPVRLCTRHALLTYARKHWPGWQLQMLGALVKLEAWLKQRWAAWRGNDRTATHFSALRDIVTNLLNGSTAAARRRLARVMRNT